MKSSPTGTLDGSCSFESLTSPTDVADALPSLAIEFTGLMLAGCDRLSREVGYRPTRFRHMVGELGGVEAVRRLLRGADASDGYTTLWEAGRLELSVEAYALHPRFASLFSESERAAARRRLTSHGFDVDAFLNDAPEDAHDEG